MINLKKQQGRMTACLLIFILLFLSAGCSGTSSADTNINGIDKYATYTSPEEVAAYIHAYSTLPSNYITRDEAKKLGWVSNEGNLAEVAPGKSIGGEPFRNSENLLPAQEGRQYYMCDVNYTSGFRNAERLVYSNDGLVYYTSDHFLSFTQMY